MATYQVYCDPGHGWIKVSKKELVRLGIADKITHFSYMRKDYAYLEEDCDAATFINRKRELGEPIVQKASHTNNVSRLRSYDSYYHKAS